MPVAGTGLGGVGGGTTRIESQKVARDLTVFRYIYIHISIYIYTVIDVKGFGIDADRWEEAATDRSNWREILRKGQDRGNESWIEE